ncbi:MAG: pyrroline-5-carboxylate reductase [Fusobacteriaceae bacterium]
MNLLFVGIGNMGGSILKSIYKGEAKDSIYVAARSQNSYSEMKKYGDFIIYEKSMLKNIDIIFLGVKPYQIKKAIESHVEGVTKDKIIVSMAAGVTLEKLETILGRDKKIVRIMPNTPIAVGEGMTAITGNENCTSEDIEKVKKVLESSSKCVLIEENKIDAFIGMAGSSPAFVYMFLEAMSDAGVRFGLTREESYMFASQAIIGAGKMAQEKLTNPGILKDMVTSPGGTTIEGVCILEEFGFRNAVIKAVSKTIEKSLEMNKNN